MEKVKEIFSTYFSHDRHPGSVSIRWIGASMLSAMLARSKNESIHIIYHGSPILQVGRNLVNQFLSVSRVRPLVRVIADKLAIAAFCQSPE